MSTTEPRLWSPMVNPGDQYFATVGDAIGHRVEMIDANPDSYPFVIQIEEWSTLPKGETPDHSVLSGAAIAEWVAESFLEECFSDELVSEYETAALHPEVVAAFDAARQTLVERQQFLVCDELIGTHRWRILSADRWEPELIISWADLTSYLWMSADWSATETRYGVLFERSRANIVSVVWIPYSQHSLGYDLASIGDEVARLEGKHPSGLQREIDQRRDYDC